MLVLGKTQVDDFLDGLKKEFDFFDVRDEILSPKHYFLPPEEETFKVDLKKGEVKDKKMPKKFVLFGLSLRDLEGITSFDEILSKPKKDFYYFRRRGQSVVIGLTNEGFEVPPGGDLILKELKNGKFQLTIVTGKGQKLVKSSKLKSVGDKFPKNSSDGSENKTMPKLRKLLLDPELLQNAVRWSWTGYPKIWDELAETCLGCGICTYVCPLCHCFSVEDRVDLSGDNCSRCRKWTACTLPEFARVAGNHSFHPTLRERYYNWFYHKFVRGYIEYGKSQCTACGRCQEQCPASIDIEGILVDIVKRYKKEIL